MFKSHLKFAFKSVKKHKVPSFINFFGFTLGLTGAVLLLSILWHDLNFDSYHNNGDRIFRLTTQLDLPNGQRHFASSSVITGQNLSETIAEIETTVRTRFLQTNLEHGDKIFANEPMLFVDDGFYDAFTVEYLDGSSPSGSGDIVISDLAKERLFGDERAIGNIIEAQGSFGSRSFQITGVFKTYPTNVSFRPSILADFDLIETLHNANYASIIPGLDTYVITNSAISNNELQKKLNTHFGEALPENIREVITHEAQMYSSIHFRRGLEFGFAQKHDKQTLWILGVLAVFIISSTFINFFNMQTALVVQRMKELSIKKALGQSWFSNAFQTSLEALVIMLPTVALSGLIISFCLTELETYTDLTLKTGLLSDSLFIWFLGVVLLAFWLLSSAISVALLSFNKRKLNLTNKSGNSLFRKGLIGLQFALAGFFILNALVISNQLSYINSLDMGYQEEGLMNVSLTGVSGYEEAKTLKNAFKRIIGVKSTSVSQSPVFGNQGKSNFTIQVDTGSVNQLLNINYIDSDFLETNQMTLLAGENIRSGGRGILLNERAVQTLGFNSPLDALGVQVTHNSRDTTIDYRVTGVISDYHYSTMHQVIEPIVLFENERGGYFNMTIRTESESFEPLIAALESQWDNFYPGHQLNYRIMEDVLDRAYEEDFQKGKFYQWATALLVGIAALGIFGLTYYYADQKRKEIGIRKAIGAKLNHILGQIARPISIVCFAAIVVSIPLGVYFSNTWLQGYEYSIQVGVLEVIITVVMMLLLSSLALLYPGIKASRINPVEALREE